MNNTQLKAFKAEEITFNNKIKSSVKLKLNHKVSHNVKYNQNGMCEAFLTVEVLDENNPEVLNVKVVVAGVFEIKNAVEKEFIHVETFKELFPYAKSLVTTITANAGIQPIIVQNVDIENQEIYRWNLKKKKNNSSKEEEE